MWSPDSFSVEKAMQKISENGFRWEEFREIFPFGFLGLREGEYAKLVDAALDSLPNDRERTVLLDLLDAQWCIYVEQLWIAHEFGRNPERFLGENHFALARLQMSVNIRLARGLPNKDGRRAMMEICGDETLMDRIACSSLSPSNRSSTGLDAVIDNATRQNMCTRWGCTTCGTDPFRGALARHLNSSEPLSEDSLRRLGKELSELKTIRNEDAVEFCILWAASGLGQLELTAVLGDGPVGRHYERMLKAKTKRDEARREHERRNSPEFVEANRAVKREAKADAHAERLRQKAIRDAEWQQKGEES
jgi:hypothetical protein